MSLQNRLGDREHPLLEPNDIEFQEGEICLKGNFALLNINLSRNKNQNEKKKQNVLFLNREESDGINYLATKYYFFFN